MDDQSSYTGTVEGAAGTAGKETKKQEKKGTGGGKDKNGKTIGRIIGIVVAILVVLVLALNSFFTIKEQEQAVVTTFGVAKAVTEPGLHFKIPFIQEVRKVDTTIRGISIGYDRENNEAIEDESLMITKDFNFINVDFFVEYKYPIQ